MTTIATDGKSMAGDSLTTAGSERVAYKQKIIRLKDGRIIGCCECAVQVAQFVRWMDNPGDDKPALDGDEFSALILNPDGTVDYIEKHAEPIRYLAPMAIGSGGDFALGAMLAGKSPAEAVEIAMLRDTRTGGDVTSLEAKL